MDSGEEIQPVLVRGSGDGGGCGPRGGRTPLGYNAPQYSAPVQTLATANHLPQTMKQQRPPLASLFRRVLWPCCIVLASGLAGAQTANIDYNDVQQLMRAGKLPEALAKTEQYIAERPRDPQLRFLRGVIQTDSGKSAEAIATFNALVQDYPELPEPYNNLAALHAAQNNYDKARTALEMAVRLNPSYTVAHENLGDVYARLASQSYAKALQLDANSAQLPAKLNLIRELFAPPKGRSGARPSAAR